MYIRIRKDVLQMNNPSQCRVVLDYRRKLFYRITSEVRAINPVIIGAIRYCSAFQPCFVESTTIQYFFQYKAYANKTRNR